MKPMRFRLKRAVLRSVRVGDSFLSTLKQKNATGFFATYGVSVESRKAHLIVEDTLIIVTILTVTAIDPAKYAPLFSARKSRKDKGIKRGPYSKEG